MEAPEGVDRLLWGLSSQVTPEGVTLCWLVDESRADRIAGFSCVFRSPAHLATGAPGVVPCWDDPADAQARSATLVELPEYGEYLVEMTALDDGVPVMEWSLRALRLDVEVTEALAGPPGPGHAVLGVPLVAACGPGGEPGWAAGGVAWQQSQIVSAAHLTHYPGLGWAPGGDPAAPPEWPEPPSLGELLEAAGADASAVGEVLGGDVEPDDETVQRAAELLAGESAAAPLARASAGTKALLRLSPGSDSGWELRLHSSYPFGSVYAYEPAHAVAGWGPAGHGATRAELWNRVDCPPAERGHAIHDVALALSTDAGDGRTMAHSGYGWWAVAPVGLMPERIVATKGGLSYGTPATAAPQAGTVWQGRVSGHLFWQRQRWALGGDLRVELVTADGRQRLAGHIDNAEIVPLDPDTLLPAGPPQPWRTLTLEAGTAEAAGHSGAGAGTNQVGDDSTAGNSAETGSARPDAAPSGTAGDWAGQLSVGAPADGEPPGMPAPDAFEGDWRAAAYGPSGTEIAGRLRLWTPLTNSDEPAEGWPAQAVLVAGFGGTTR